MAKTERKSSPPLAAIPEWADRIRRKYLRGEANVFLLHHNIFDSIPYENRLLDIQDFLAEVLLGGNKKTILSYDPSSRVKVLKKPTDVTLAESLLVKRASGEVLPALEEFFLTNSSTALLIPYTEIVAPNGEMNFLANDDRAAVATLHRWSLDDRFAKRDNVVFLLAEQLASVHSALVSNPKIASIEIPIPDHATRLRVCQLTDPSLTIEEASRLATHTAGLKAIHIQGVLAQTDEAEGLADGPRTELITKLLGDSANAAARATKLASLTRSMSEDEIRHLLAPDAKRPAGDLPDPFAEVLKLVRVRKREIIETECYGLIEFIEANHDFSAVGGLDEVKKELSRIAANIKSGNKARVPMGLLLVGPMGTGKTFLAGAFARECGITAVKLKNFRSKWVGSTEANLEKVLTILKALGPIMVIVDEGERAFGDAGDGDGGTGSRVIGRIKEFMSDTENRGQVLFIMMTNRPDKLDADIKRAGRLDRKFPMFYASEPSEVEGVIAALLRRNKVNHLIEFPRDRAALSERLVGYSNADIEAVVLLANDLGFDEGGQVSAAVFERAISDYLPSRDEAMLRFMELQAVFEASNRKMLPPKYRNLTNAELDSQMRAARLAIAR